jgi:hypothetical protein
MYLVAGQLARRFLAISLTLCLALASIAPGVAIACEGVDIEVEPNETPTRVSSRTGFTGSLHNGSAFNLNEVGLRYPRGFEDNGSECNGLRVWRAGTDCRLLIRPCRTVGDREQLIIEIMRVDTFMTELECVA